MISVVAAAAVTATAVSAVSATAVTAVGAHRGSPALPAGLGHAGVYRLTRPGSSHPGVRGVVGSQPGPLAGAGHHVQVVEVVPGGGHGRTVITVRYEHDIAVADFGEEVDGTSRRPVDPLESKAILAARPCASSK